MHSKLGDRMVQITFHSASQYRSAPQEYGIYAWYYLPNFNDADADELIEKIQKAENKKKIEIAKAWLVENYYKKYWLFLDSGREPEQELTVKENWMNITPSIRITAKAARYPNIGDDLPKLMCDDENFLRQYLENLGSSNSLPFLSPIYIGMAKKGESHIQKRLGTHLKELSQAEKLPKKTLEERFKPGSSTGKFANRAAIAGIDSTQLWFATFPVRDTEHDNMPDKLENLFNRLTTPSLGSN
mgnify:CR=1 FL=1